LRNDYVTDETGNVLTIPLVTLVHIEKQFSPTALLSMPRIKEMPEGQQLGYIKGVSDLLAHLRYIHEGGN
jgi:hypothetical protein